MGVPHKMDVVAQAATEYVLPAWAVIVGFISSILIALTVLWNWMTSVIARMVQQEVDVQVDTAMEKVEAKLERYEANQAQIMADVAYIRGRIDAVYRKGDDES